MSRPSTSLTRASRPSCWPALRRAWPAEHGLLGLITARTIACSRASSRSRHTGWSRTSDHSPTENSPNQLSAGSIGGCHCDRSPSKINDQVTAERVQPERQRLERQLLATRSARAARASRAPAPPHVAHPPFRALAASSSQLGRSDRPHTRAPERPPARTARRAATAPPAAARDRAPERARGARPCAVPSCASRSRRRRSLLGTSSSSPRQPGHDLLARARPRLRRGLQQIRPPRAPVSPVQRRAHVVLRRAPQRPALLARERPRPRRVAQRQPRARALRSSTPSPPAASRAIVSAVERVEAHLLAARGDRRQHVLPAVAHQQQVREGRGLLERLQQPVRRLLVQRLRRSRSRTRAARDSNGVRVAAATTGSSMSLTSISAAPLGRHPRQVRVRPARRALPSPQAPSAGRAPRRPAARRRTPARSSRLPAPDGPWSRYACEGLPRRQSGPQDGTRVRVRLDPGQQCGRIERSVTLRHRRRPLMQALPCCSWPAAV